MPPQSSATESLKERGGEVTQAMALEEDNKVFHQGSADMALSAS